MFALESKMARSVRLPSGAIFAVVQVPKGMAQFTDLVVFPPQQPKEIP